MHAEFFREQQTCLRHGSNSGPFLSSACPFDMVAIHASTAIPAHQMPSSKAATDDDHPSWSLNGASGSLPGFRAKFATPEHKRHKSQIEAVSPATPAPLVDLGSAKVSSSSHLSMLCLELFVQTRQKLRPDPEYDPILGCFYRLMSADDDWDPVTGCIIVGPPDTLQPSQVVRQHFVASELMLVKSMVRLVRDTDPDILAGYEVQMASWGYLSARAAVLDINLCPLLSRVPASVKKSKVADEEGNPGAAYDAGHTSEISLVGRNVFNIWRLMRSIICRCLLSLISTRL